MDRLYDHLNEDSRQEVGLEEDIDPGHRSQGRHHVKKARHRILPCHHCDGTAYGHPAEDIEKEVGAEEKAEKVSH